MRGEDRRDVPLFYYVDVEARIREVVGLETFLLNKAFVERVVRLA